MRYNTTMTTITTASGRTKTLPAHVANWSDIKVVGLDPAGRIVVDQFGVLTTDDPKGDDFLFALSLCCAAFDKGTEWGVACRSCFGDEAGDYLFRSHGFPGLDPVVA